MKLSHCMFAVLCLLGISQANACGFRLNDGSLLRCGMARIELLSQVGEPMSKSRETLGVDISNSANIGSLKTTNNKQQAETIETWAYRLKGDIGGEYMVSLRLVNGKVTSINRKQLGRL